MSVRECISKLVQAGKITRAMGDEAEALFERAKGEFRKSMGPASADAAAALAVAREMEAGAKKLKYQASKQALGWANFERRKLQHDRGPVAGIMSQLVRDIWGKGGENVSSQSEVIWADLSRLFADGMQAYKPGVLGLGRDQIRSVRNLIREGFGVSTGDQTAAAAARGFKDATDEGVERWRAAGHNIEPNEHYRFPQHWTTQRVRLVTEEEYKRFWAEQHESGGVNFWDREQSRPATPERIDAILSRAYRDITTNNDGIGTFSREIRTFQFSQGEAGAASWLSANDRFGSGDDIIGMLTGHLGRMAREIALSEVIGPNHAAIIRAAMAGVGETTPVLARWIENRSLVDRTYDMLTGRANAVEGEKMAGFFGGLRSIATASTLPSAVISSVPSDSVTAAFAANHVGMPVGRLLDGVARELARGGKESRVLAARLHLTAHSAQEYSHGYRTFQDQIGGPDAFKWVATTMIRAQGLQAWTELIKRTFTMEFTGHLADHAKYNLAKLRTVNKPLADFLDTYQISAAEWDAIRATKPHTVEGATFLDTMAIADRGLREKLLGGIIDERAFAMLEPDARIRALTAGRNPRGSFHGEIGRSVFLFKSFAMTMGATHVMRIATQGPIESRIWNGAAFATFSALAGAAAIQAKNLVYGKDPESMLSGTFWAKAFAQGGALGIYGGLIDSSVTRSGRGIVADLAGPIGGAAEDVVRLTSTQVRKLYGDKDTTFAAEAVRTAKRWTPKTFYTKLAVDRLLFDQIQMLADPDYRGSFRRMEQRLKRDTGQQFWWGPGDAAPERAPDLGRAVR